VWSEVGVVPFHFVPMVHLSTYLYIEVESVKGNLHFTIKHWPRNYNYFHVPRDFGGLGQLFIYNAFINMV
jgi:hypothetical protein